MMRWFAWDDPGSARADSFGQNKTIEVNNTTSSRDVLYPSYQSSLWPDLTGAFTNDGYITDFDTFAKGTTDTHGVTKSGLYLTDAQWLQLPQLQTNNKGGQLDEFGNKVDFLTGNVHGWTITYWAKTKWPSSSYDPTVYDEDYQWFNIGYAGTPNSLGHFTKYKTTDVEGVLRGNASNYVYAGNTPNQPPDPILQGTGEFWTFYAISYGGGQVGGDFISTSTYKANDILWAAGTGSPSTSSLKLYSGDVLSVPAGFDDGLRIRGNQMRLVGDDTDNTWLNLDDKNAFVFGSGAASSAVRPITGYISDFRLYSGHLNTGQIKNIYLGRENMPEEICVDGATNSDSALVQAHDGTYVLQDSLYNNNLWWENANNWSIKNSDVVFFISHEGDGNSYSAYLTANKQSPTDYAGNWLAAGAGWSDGENLTVVQGTCAPTTTAAPTTTTAGPTTTTAAPTTTTTAPTTTTTAGPTPAPNPRLLKDGLMMRWFAWDDPDSDRGSSFSSSETVDVNGSQVSRSVFYPSYKSSLLPQLTGAVSDNTTFSTWSDAAKGITDIYGTKKTGVYFTNDIEIQFPQIQDDTDGGQWSSFNNAMNFLTGIDQGFTVTFWMHNNYSALPSSENYDYKIYEFGGDANPTNIGLYYLFDGTDRICLRGSSTDFIYAQDAGNVGANNIPDIIYHTTGNYWTFHALSYAGGGVANSSAPHDNQGGGNIMWTVGTGNPASNDNRAQFFSGDYDSIPAGYLGGLGVRGGTYYKQFGGNGKDWFLKFNDDHSTVLGDAGNETVTESWPGYMSDLRLYSGDLGTGDLNSIFTGQGLV
jgi:hypothetical protein